MICFDALFPEAARVLMLRGAEVILVPNASDYPAWRRAVLQTRAIENMVGLAMANYPGEPRGGSCAFDPIPFREVGDEEAGPRDTTIVVAGPEPGIFLARFDLDRLRRFRERETQGDAYRKPSAYAPIVSNEVRPPFARPDARR
jgi:predicted amidohydrolase